MLITASLPRLPGITKSRKAERGRNSCALVFGVMHFLLDQLFQTLACLRGQLPAGACFRMTRAITPDHSPDNAEMLPVMLARAARRQMRAKAELFLPGEFYIKRLGDQRPVAIAASEYQISQPRPMFSVRLLIVFTHYGSNLVTIVQMPGLDYATHRCR
jgi:hypothetical protein